ncbi:MAG: hypothetical protein ACRC4K_02235 [Plesiomonas shigelloides]
MRELAHTMPLLIPSADFDMKLQRSESNHAHAEAFIASGVVDYHVPGYSVPHGYRFVSNMKGDQFRLLTLGDTPEIVYALKIIFRQDVVVGTKTCTQVMVWRTSRAGHSRALQGLASLVFDHLLSTHVIMVSDNMQTHDGRRFWMARISEAINAGYSVYMADGTEEEFPLHPITNDDQLYDSWCLDDECVKRSWDGDIWGEDRDVHIHRYLVISKSKI